MRHATAINERWFVVLWFFSLLVCKSLLQPLKHGYGTALTYPVSEMYPIRIRLGYGRDTYPRRVRVSQVMWAGNLRMETSRPGRYGPAAQSRVPTSRSRLRLTHGQKGRTASAVPRLALLLAPPSSSPSPFASPRRSRPRSTPPSSSPSPFSPRSTRTSRARVALRLPDWAPSSAADSRSASSRRPPRGVVALPESPFDSQIGAAKAATLLGRPRSEADDLLKTRRPLPAVVLLPPSCSSSLSSLRRLHPRAGSSPPPRPGQRPARTGRGAPRRPRFASTQPPPTKPTLDSCPLLR